MTRVYSVSRGSRFLGKNDPKFALQIMFELEKIDLETPEQLFFNEYGPNFKAYASPSSPNSQNLYKSLGYIVIPNF